MNPRELLKACQIPSVPIVLREILEATDNQAMTSAALEKLVLKDAGLSFQLLKTVNSSYFALRSKVKVVSQAIVLLGFPTIKNITAGLVLLETFSKMKKADQDYLKKVWQCSIETAGLVKFIAKKESKKNQENLVLAAMVHHIGHLILAQYFGDQYKRLCEGQLFPNCEAERVELGLTHASVGAELLQQWKFQEELVLLVGQHHDRKNFIEDKKQVDYLSLADQMILLLESNPGLLELRENELPPDLKNLLKCTETSWTDLSSSLRETSSEAGAFKRV
ncbi:MAG: HDOD domain-containing protein [Bdellovibrionota bacterium]